MASASNSCQPIRSISLPSRSHPIIVRIEEQLRNLKTWEASPKAQNICNALSGLEELYMSMNDLLNLPRTQEVLSHRHHGNMIDELLDGSMWLLDISGTTRDFVSQIKEHVRDLQSSLRRKQENLCLSKLTSFRKKMKKDAKKFIPDLKEENKKVVGTPISDQDNHLLMVVRVLREINAMNISILQSILLFFYNPILKPNPAKWYSLASMFMRKGRVAYQEELDNMNELETLEATTEGIENGLECMFRCLIRTRTSLLNILSH